MSNWFRSAEQSTLSLWSCLKSLTILSNVLLTRSVLTYRQSDFQSLPFQQFQVLLTLLSKVFSSFPHGTSLLSVSHQYLAVEEVYLPFSAALPSNATHLKYTERKAFRVRTGPSPSLALLSNRLTPDTSQVILRLQLINWKSMIFTVSSSLFARRY